MLLFTKWKNMDNSNFQSTLLGRFYENRKGLFRLWLFIAGLHLVSLLLGFAIYFMVFGIQIAVSRVFVYWLPARNWLAKTFNLIFPEPDTSKISPSYVLFVNIFHSLIVFLFIAFGYYVTKTGVDILIRDGFLGQNFIYLIFFR